MPRVFVDQREIAFPLTGFTSLNGVLRHVQESHLPPNVVIRQVNLDGQPLTALENGPVSARKQGDTHYPERIEIFTGPLVDVVRESVEEAIAYLDRAALAIPSVSASFQGAPGPQAFESLKQLYEGCYWINLLMDRMQDTPLPGLNVNVVPPSLTAERKQKFITIMKQMVEAQERSEYILIADILEFEILPSIPVWREILEQFQGKIGNRF